MLELQAVYTDSGKKYTFKFDELTKNVLTDEQLATIKGIILKEISKL